MKLVSKRIIIVLETVPLFYLFTNVVPTVLGTVSYFPVNSRKRSKFAV